MQVGFVGTGTMGNPMARCLIEAGHQLHLACELAREVGAPAHIGLLTDDVLKRAQAQGWGQRGFPIAARILEAMAGLELRAPAARDAVGYQQQDPRRG